MPSALLRKAACLPARRFESRLPLEFGPGPSSPSPPSPLSLPPPVAPQDDSLLWSLIWPFMIGSLVSRLGVLRPPLPTASSPTNSPLDLAWRPSPARPPSSDRKSTRLNSRHSQISH